MANSRMCAPVRVDLATGWGARGAPGSTFLRARSTKNEPTSVPTPQPHRTGSFIRCGSRGRPVGNFYEKGVVSSDGRLTSTLLIEYPRERKAFFDPIVTRMSRSFQPATDRTWR
jgi:hypothetical protein